MDRREFIGTTATVGVAAIAGCSGGGSGNVDGEIVVDETVFSRDIQRFNFEVEQGQMVNVYINNIEGARTTVVLTDAEGETTKTFEAETESTGTHEASMTGVYAVNITTLGEAEVVVGLE